MAQSVTQKLIGQAGLTKQIQVDSAGTHAHHIGEKPDPRALAVLKQKGYEAGRIRSRRIVAKDFVFFDAIFAMDASNLADLKRICPPEHLGKLKLCTLWKAKPQEMYLTLTLETFRGSSEF